MALLILLRHGQSQWNLEKRFTGWEDIDLTEQGRQEARSAGLTLKDVQIDKVYASKLRRSIETAQIVLREMGIKGMYVIENESLNERHYGDLQGLCHVDAEKQYGTEQVRLWRRSFNICPPGARGESLELTLQRVEPYYRSHIEPDLEAGKNVLVVAHGNSIRALLYLLDTHTQESILDLEIPTGIPFQREH